jgi:hypothetical protein
MVGLRKNQEAIFHIIKYFFWFFLFWHNNYLNSKLLGPTPALKSSITVPDRL